MPLITIAGIVGDVRGNDLQLLCGDALGGLRLFGSGPRIERVPGGAFGSLAPVDDRGRADSLFRDERRLVAVDGSLENEADIGRALSIDPTSTAGLVTAAWDKWGERCVERFVGEFAIALFDLVDRRFWLARDPSGYRPLFYAQVRDGFAFASMPSGLLSILDTGPDLARLAGYIEGAHFESGWTFWDRVHQVPSGSLLELPSGTCRSLLPAAIDARSAAEWDDLVAEMRARLDAAVTRSLAGAGSRLGGQLSSGLDSSAVVATAARSLGSGQSLLALTAAPATAARLLVPRGRFADEAPLAAETARQCGVEHVVFRDRERLLPAIRGSSPYFQQPAPAQFSFPWWRAMNQWLHERGGRVMLTAGMGNGTLSHGGIAALSRYLQQGNIVGWLREIRAARARRESRLRGLAYNSFEPWIPLGAADRLWRASQGLASAPPSFVRSEWRMDVHAADRTRQSYAQTRLAMIRNFDAGTRKRGMHALTGIEERDPLADRELMGFALSLPPEAHLKDGRAKPLVRDALADRVPASILTASLRGVSGADWYDRIDPKDCREAMDDIRASPSASEILDLRALDRAIDNWPAFDPRDANSLSEFGARIARALSTGLFLAEIDRYPLGKPRQ